MARYIGPKLKISRRFGVKLGLRTNEEGFTRRPYKPGQHGPTARRSRPSEYNLQLMEKQKAKFIYGILERQFRKYYELAAKSQNIGLTLMQLLETRLDTVLYRGGFAMTQNQARQFVNHGHVLVNGKRVSIPSFRVLPGMVVSVDAKLAKLVEDERGQSVDIPNWLKSSKNEVTVLDMPVREQIPSIINEQLIVEFYSR
ncbi:MAG TPA: 30S ribosomal protein S4 [Verrucomicrobiae bacterium]|nr:30S ribosomal protein S4 [Verrucomicrobiae bacterium]